MAGSPFFARIRSDMLAIARSVPPGQAVTYADIGRHLDVMPRHVACILKMLPDPAAERIDPARIIASDAVHPAIVDVASLNHGIAKQQRPADAPAATFPAAAMIRLAQSEDVVLLPAIEASAAQLFAGTALAHLAQGATTPPAALAAGVCAGSLWIADDGTPAGFLLAAATSGWLHIAELSVAQHAQGRGLGTALLLAAIAAAPGLGCARLSLVTDRLLPWNAPFYARHGFAEVGAHVANVPDWLADKLAPTPGDGLDPARRCIMVRST